MQGIAADKAPISYYCKFLKLMFMLRGPPWLVSPGLIIKMIYTLTQKCSWQEDKNHTTELIWLNEYDQNLVNMTKKFTTINVNIWPWSKNK